MQDIVLAEYIRDRAADNRLEHLRRAGRLGALARYRIYGNPGTPEGRRKAGQLLVEWIRNHPEAAKLGGVAVAKEIKHPPRSPLLAEFVGVLLGDGGIRNALQVTISFDQKKDREYVKWLQRTVKRLFGLEGFLSLRKNNFGGDIVVSSVKLVRCLPEIAGLRPGNKLRNGLDVPDWIWERRSYQIGCLRGLMDTDGGPFIHRYQVAGKWYAYPKLCFYSASELLRRSVCRLFSNLGFHPRLAGSDLIFVDRVDQVRNFYRVIGSRHERHINLVNLCREGCESGRFELTANELTCQKRVPGFKSQPLRHKIRAVNK